VLYVFCADGIWGSAVGSGRYLRFTVDLEMRRGHKILCAIIFFFTPVPLIAAAGVIFSAFGFNGLYRFLKFGMMEYITLAAVIFNLAKPVVPKFNYKNDAFENAQFNRGRIVCSSKRASNGASLLGCIGNIKFNFSTFMEHNDSFCGSLAEAIWFARSGRVTDIEEMLINPGHVKPLLDSTAIKAVDGAEEPEPHPQQQQQQNPLSSAKEPETPSKPPSEPAQVTCACGATLKATAKFCHVCGAKQPTATTPKADSGVLNPDAAVTKINVSTKSDGDNPNKSSSSVMAKEDAEEASQQDI